MWIGECLSEDCPPTNIGFAIESKTVKGVDMLVSWLLSREPTVIPPKSTVDDSPT